MAGAKEAGSKGETTTSPMYVKAEKFSRFLEENKIVAFSKEVLTGDIKAVVYHSRIEVQGSFLSTALIVDDSVFTIIRVQIVDSVSIGRQDELLYYINMLNEKYKLFKYYLRPDGIVYLDVVLPFSAETFDSGMIRLMLGILVQQVEENYADIIKVARSGEEN